MYYSLRMLSKYNINNNIFFVKWIYKPNWKCRPTNKNKKSTKSINYGFGALLT